MAEPKPRKSLFQRPDMLLVDEPPLIQMPISSAQGSDLADDLEDALIPAIEEGDDTREPARIFLGIPGGKEGALSQSPGSMLPEAVSQLEEILGGGPRAHRPRRPDGTDDGFVARAERTNSAIRIPRMELGLAPGRGDGPRVDALGEPFSIRAERTNPAIRMPRLDPELEPFSASRAERTNPAMRIPVVEDSFESHTVAARGNHAHKGRDLVDALIEIPMADDALFIDPGRNRNRRAPESRPALGMKLELKPQAEGRPEGKPESSAASRSAMASFDEMTAPPIPWKAAPPPPPAPPLPPAPVARVNRDRLTPGPERTLPRADMKAEGRMENTAPKTENAPFKVENASPKPEAPRPEKKPNKALDPKNAETTFPRNVSRSENRTLETKLEQLESMAAEKKGAERKENERRENERREEERQRKADQRLLNERNQEQSPGPLRRESFPPLPAADPLRITTGTHRRPPVEEEEEGPRFPVVGVIGVTLAGLALGGLMWFMQPRPTAPPVAEVPVPPIQLADAGGQPVPPPPEPVPQTGLLQLWADQQVKVWVDGGYKGVVEGRGGDAGPQSGPSNLDPIELSPGPHTVKAQAGNGRVRVVSFRIDEGRRTDLVLRFSR